MADFFEKFQREGNPFVAYMVREAMEYEGPLQGYIFLEAIRRLWILIVRHVSSDAPPPGFYREMPDLQILKKMLEEKELLDETRSGSILDNEESVQIFKLLEEFISTVLEPEYIANGNFDELTATHDLLKDLISAVGQIAWSSVLVNISNDAEKTDAEKTMEHIGASNRIIIKNDEDFEGTALKTDSGLIRLGPATQEGMLLLPTGRDGISEDIRGNIILKEGQRIEMDGLNAGMTALAKCMAFWGEKPADELGILIEHDMEDAASAIAVWGGFYGGAKSNIELMEAVTANPQIITPAFMTVFDLQLNEDLDTAIGQARTNADDEALMHLLMTKQALESDPQKKVVVLGTLANLYEEKLKNPEQLFYISCKLFQVEPSMDEGLDDLIQQAKKLEKQAELADFLVGIANEGLDNKGLAYRILTQAAVLFMEMNMREEALDAASGAMAMQPDAQDILSRLCGVFERLGDLESLKNCMEQKLDTATTVGEAITLHLDLGTLLKSRLNDRKKALEYYYKAFDMAPGNEQVFNALKNELMEDGRIDEVSGIYTKALSKAIEPAARASLLRGYINITDEILKESKRTIGLLRELLIFEPEPGEEASRLLELYIQEGMIEDFIGLGWKIAIKDKDSLLFERILKEADPLRQIWLIRASKDIFPDLREEELTALHDAGMSLDAAILLESMAEEAKGEKAADYWLRTAKIYEDDIGLLEKAAKCYENAYEMNPCGDNVDKLAVLYQKLGKTNELYLFLHENLEKVADPDIQARMMGWMGEIAEKEMKDTDVAIQYFDRALDLVPTMFDIAEKLYDILLKKGDTEKALVIAETAIETAIRTNTNESVARFNLLAGKASLRVGDHIKAIKYLEGLRAGGAIGPELLMAMGKAYTLTGQTAQAKEVLQEVLTKFGQDMNAMDKSMVLEELGDAAMDDAKYELALKLYLDGKKAMPGNNELLIKALDASKQAHDYYTAVDILEDIIYKTSDKEQRIELFIQLGEMYAQELKYTGDAEKAYRKALELNKDSRAVMHKLLKLHIEAGEYEKTLNILAELLRVEEDGAKKAGYHHTAGMLILEHLDDTDAALKHFEQSIIYNPSGSDALEMMISLLSEKGNYDAVASLLKKQVDTFRELGDQTLELAMLEKLKDLYSKQLHNPVRTAEVMEEIALIKGKNPDDLKTIADGYAKVKTSMGRALETYMELMEMDPTRKDVYMSVRNLYHDMGDSDGYWSVCGVLSVLGLATPEENRFYVEHKQAALKLKKDHLDEKDFKDLVAARDEDQDILKLLELTWPAMRQSLVWQQPSEVGIKKTDIIDVNGSGAFETIYRVIVRLLGIKAPRAFLMPKATGITKVPFNPPALVVGEDIYKGTRGKDLRFLLGKYLSLFTPGRVPFGVVDVQTLRSAITAVTKFSFPNFTIPQEAKEAEALLVSMSKYLTQEDLNSIREILTKLRRDNSKIDFEALAAAVDITSNHMAFFMSDDISIALRNIKNNQPGFSNLQPADMIVALTRYACSPEYITLRRLILKR